MAPQLTPPALPARSGLARVATRAALDRCFREWLLADPHAAMHEVLGVDLGASFRVRFVEKTPDVDLLVVLPDLVEHADQLDAGQLDAVLGGAGSSWLVSGPRGGE